MHPTNDTFLITPCGAYENAYLRFLMAHTHPRPNANADDNPGGYYGVLTRLQSDQHVERMATFVALCDEIRVASFDWMFRPEDTSNYVEPTLRNRDIGLALTYDEHQHEWDRELKVFAGLLIRFGGISERSLNRLRLGGGKTGEHLVEGLGQFEATSFQGLCRLLHQVRTAEKYGSRLLIDDSDLATLREIVEFVKSRAMPTPFELPDVRKGVEDQDPNLGFFLLRAPDFASLLAVRNDTLIKQYAARIRPILLMDDPTTREQMLIPVMAASADRVRAARHASAVFEAVGWTFDALQFVPVLGSILSLPGMVFGLLEKWVERKRSASNWYAIGPKMNEIALDDYLLRMHNRNKSGQNRAL